MREDIDQLLARCGGASSRALMLRHGIPRHALDEEVRQGALVRLFRRSYCRAWNADDIECLEMGALFSVGMPAALSHLSALRRWGLLGGATDVHLTVPVGRCFRPYAGLVVHRARRFPPVVRLRGAVTTTVASAIAESWPVLAGPDQRGPAITAVRRRLVSADELRKEMDRHPRLAGRGGLLALADLLAAGCDSELEIWGYLDVFDVPGLNNARRQKVVRAGGKVYRLDLAYEQEQVAVELDGDRYHSSREQREADRRRDAALAAIGWLTLRYSHQRLHADIAGCRRDTLATLAVRNLRPPRP